MPPLSILRDRAFLISPLEIPVYILELPVLKETLIEREIRNQLKTLYPGTPENTVVDYTLFRPKNRDRDQRLNTAAVFVSSLPVYNIYRDLKRPLISGITLMSEGIHTLGGGKIVSILCTPQWIETALFENSVIRRYGSCPLRPEGLPLSLITPLLSGSNPKEIPVLLIIAGSGEKQNEDITILLNQMFNRVIHIYSEEIVIRGKLKGLGIFTDTKKNSLNRRRGSIKTLVVLNLVSLLLSLHVVSAEKKRELSQLESCYREQNRRQDEAEKLEKEITELLSRKPAKSKEQSFDTYGIISKIQPCLAEAWIKSLVIQDLNFNLEAEGADSIGVLQSLQASGYFRELTLHQASPSGISGEQFTVSGRVRVYETE